VAVLGVERGVPAARLHLVEPVAAIAAEQGDESPTCPRAALQCGPDHARFAALAQFLRDRDDVVPGFRWLQPGLFENIGPIVLHLTVTVRRQSIQLAAFRRRFVAIQIEHVLRDVGKNVLFEFRILIKIRLEAFQRAFGNELRRVVVVVEDHVIAVRFGGERNRRLRQHISNRLGEYFHLDVREFLLEQRVDAFFRKLPALACRSPGYDRRSGGARWANNTRVA
jgi:hypothetical protein